MLDGLALAEAVPLAVVNVIDIRHAALLQGFHQLVGLVARHHLVVRSLKHGQRVLDLIGDLSLLGSPVLGHVIADRSGHSMHLGLMQAIADNPDCWEYVKFQRNGKSVFKQVVIGTRSAGDKLNHLVMPQIAEPVMHQPVAV